MDGGVDPRTFAHRLPWGLAAISLPGRPATRQGRRRAAVDRPGIAGARPEPGRHPAAGLELDAVVGVRHRLLVGDRRALLGCGRVIGGIGVVGAGRRARRRRRPPCQHAVGAAPMSRRRSRRPPPRRPAPAARPSASTSGEGRPRRRSGRRRSGDGGRGTAFLCGGGLASHAQVGVDAAAERPVRGRRHPARNLYGRPPCRPLPPPQGPVRTSTGASGVVARRPGGVRCRRRDSADGADRARRPALPDQGAGVGAPVAAGARTGRRSRRPS